MWRLAISILVVLIVAGILTSVALQAPSPRVSVRPDTTVVLGPLLPNGYVDYVTALNLMCREGVTTENNAAVLLMQAFGPSEITEAHRGRFFEMLGIEPLPEEGSYVVTSSAFERQLKEEAGLGDRTTQEEEGQGFSERLGTAMDRLWSEDEFPDVARWLEINEEPLQLIVEASRRTRFYTPMIASADGESPGMVVAILLPILQECREAARLLAARATLRLHEGKVDEAWQDIVACHRLGRLTGQDPTLVGALVCIAIDGIAATGDSALIQHGNLTAEQARKMLADLQALAPLPLMAEKVNTAERFMYLDGVCAIARGQSDFMLDETEPSSAVSRFFRGAAGALIDWDLILREGNRWYDRVVDALSKPTHIERTAAMAAIEADINSIADEVKDPLKALGSFFTGKSPRRNASEKLCHILIALMLPAVDATRTAQDRATSVNLLTQIGYGLAAYRADRGNYPDKLEELEPEYLANLPKDPFTGESFRYRREDQGFLVYCLGPNMEDNGGKVDYLDRDKAGPNDDTSTWDDYRLRIPVAMD